MKHAILHVILRNEELAPGYSSRLYGFVVRENLEEMVSLLSCMYYNSSYIFCYKSGRN